MPPHPTDWKTKCAVYPPACGVGGCEGSSHTLDDFISERVEETHTRKPVMWDFPPLREYWDQNYWLQVQGTRCSRNRPARALTYGPDPSVFQSQGHSLYLPWKRGGRGKEGGDKEGEGGKAAVGARERVNWQHWRECRDTSSKPTEKPKTEKKDIVMRLFS